MEEEMRVCRICGIEQPILEFGVAKYRKNGRAYRRRECRACTRARQMEWINRNRERVRERGRENMRKYRAALPPEQREAKLAELAAYQRQRNAKLRKEVYAAYGGYICACCGETEPLFLSIDHINNDGYVRRKGGEPVGVGLWQKLKNEGYPPGYQVLCMNCNHGKSRNGGVCPHHKVKEGSTAIPGGGVGPSGPKRADPAPL